MSQDRLTIRPCTLRAANEYVSRCHRHHGPTRGHKFSVQVVDDQGAVRGVGIAGRPVARRLDNGLTLEAVRVATDGCPNACSALYGAIRRIARGMGYERLITYILADEPGTSLKAAGWHMTKDDVPGGSWSVPSRQRQDDHPTGPKTRWEADL